MDDWFDLSIKICMLAMFILLIIFMIVGLDYLIQIGFDSHGVAIP